MYSQLLLSADGSNPTAHWQAKDAGSALLDTLAALATQEHWLVPVAMALLSGGHVRNGS
jgi:hypothetical protein